MNKKILLLICFGIFMSACQRNSNRIFTEEDTIKIYVANELSSPKEAEVVIEQYGLGNESKRRAYYDTLRDLTDTPEKYDVFLEKVDQYKQEKFANTATLHFSLTENIEGTSSVNKPIK